MNKKIVKVISMVMILFMVLSTFSIVNADFIDTAKKTDADGTFDTLGSSVVGLLKGIGTILAVAILIVLGLKYMMGSTEEKAEYKKTMIPYLIGAVLIFAAPYVADWIIGFATSIGS